MAKFRLSMFHLSKYLNAMFRLSTSISTYVLLALLAGGSSWAVEVEEEEGPWWSLLPLVKPAVPDDQTTNAIDRFIGTKHTELGLTMAVEADRRTLVRRLYFDLWGLPPTPEEAGAFAADEDPAAYPKLVEKLLASPRYGERWARHWLDIVHYGETHGYDKDKPRPNAWPYRDYVIRAFNEDKPYARFIKEQLAGDVLWPGTVDGIVATGFIAAGPWDFIGHAEVSEEKIDGKIARHLDRDDMVATTMNAFCSITVQCAQCHDHRVDPVTMKDYYALQSVFAALDRADRKYDTDPATAAKRAMLTARKAKHEAQRVEIETKIAANKPAELVALEKKIAALENRVSAATAGKRSERFGYHSQVAVEQDTVKWVQVDLGEKRRIDQVVLVGADEYGFADFGFPHRFKIEIADEADFENPRLIADQTGADYPRPGATPVSFDGSGVEARYLRVTGTKLWNRRNKGQPESGDWIFAIGELAVISEGELVSVSDVTAFDSIEGGERWGKKNLIDGFYGAYSLEALAANEKSQTNGYHSSFAPSADTAKWVQIDLGSMLPIDRIELYPARPTDFADTPGFGFPIRFNLEVSGDATAKSAKIFADHSGADYPNPGDMTVALEGESVSGRYVRLNASVLNRPQGSGGPMLAMAEMRVFSAGVDVSRNAAVSSLDTINSGLWHRNNLVDGYTSRGRIGSGADELLLLARTESGAAELREEVSLLTVKRDALFATSIDPALVRERDELVGAIARASSELAALAKPKMVYAGTVHHGGGAFIGRGHAGGKPRDVFILTRGSVTQPAELVKPATLPNIVPGVAHEFELAADHDEGERRVALAEWITHPENMLTWRSIANRIWQYHFGRGIVDTPNDFGRIGEKPSHPELLDWLAVSFRDNGGSVKTLHRAILNSATYKQSSAHHAKNAEIDNSNQFLWRQNRRRVEAEAVHDTVLSLSGKMDFKMGGPSYKDFVIEQPQHSPHYQYHLYDPDDVSTHRRSVYRFIVRSQPQPFMDTLDCADPSQLVAKRGETTTALQALALLNNRFMVRMAEHFAERVKTEPDPVAVAFGLAVSREATQAELADLQAYADKHGLPATCRLIFNLNEFAYID